MKVYILELVVPYEGSFTEGVFSTLKATMDATRGYYVAHWKHEDNKWWQERKDPHDSYYHIRQMTLDEAVGHIDRTR